MDTIVIMYLASFALIAILYLIICCTKHRKLLCSNPTTVDQITQVESGIATRYKTCPNFYVVENGIKHYPVHECVDEDFVFEEMDVVDAKDVNK